MGSPAQRIEPLTVDAAAAAWRRWRAPLSLGVLDQAVVSAANFAVAILLARWLSPADYGAFAVALATLLLVAGPHAALLTDPLPVVGARRPADRYSAYLHVLVIAHAALTVPLGVLIALSAFLPAPILNLSAGWTAILGLITPLVLLSWLLRAACYLPLRPGVALAGSAVYSVTLVILIAWGNLASWLTAPGALLSMGAASALASLVIARRLGLPSRRHGTEIAGVIREHWTYGRWILGASVAHGIAYGLYIPLLATLFGLEHSAALRALQNLILPLQQLLAGMTMIAYPTMSRGVAEGGQPYLRRRGPAFVIAGTGLAVVYGIALAVSGRPLLMALYGGGYYDAYASLMIPLAIAAVLSALAQSLGILVRVLNRPDAVLWSKLAAAAWLAAGGVFLMRDGGVRGAVFGLAGAALAETCVLVFALFRRPSLPGATS